jgi:Fe-Mn family superoxide dismutase
VRVQLADAVSQYFTDFEGLKEAFKRAVMSRVLPGWIWLGVCPDGRLLLTQTNNEENPLMHGVVDVQCVPIIGMDLWEHAYL